ncbi:MAG: hypothetical protein R3A78_06060 [Polyangiales bacterium]|nr:hypothetical protein [Myxococcales bacterium]
MSQLTPGEILNRSLERYAPWGAPRYVMELHLFSTGPGIPPGTDEPPIG